MSAAADAMPASAPAAGAQPKRRHRGLVAALLVIATILGFFACFAVWVNRQALNTTHWTNTSSEILANPQVQEALSTYLVNELFTHENVSARLQTALPSQVQGLAGPLSAGLRAVADRVVPKLLASSQVQALWRRSNRAAHRELLTILNGGTKAVSTSGGEVSLNLHELVSELGSQLGLTSQVETARSKLSGGTGAAVRSTVQEKTGVTLPAGTGVILIMRSKQLKTAQNVAKGIKGLSLVLPLLALALFALAIRLAEGWRRRALRTTGFCFFGVGVALLLLRRVAGQGIVTNLVANPSNRPAAEAVWSIGTSLLYTIAVAMVLYGLVLVAAAWLAGHTRPARWLRRAAAPFMRMHPGGSYAVAGVILLLVVFWGPTPATRQLLPVLGFAALGAFGLSILRRQTATEFPDAVSGEAVAEMREWWPFGRAAAERRDARWAESRAAHSQAPSTPPSTAPPAGSDGSPAPAQPAGQGSSSGAEPPGPRPD